MKTINYLMVSALSSLRSIIFR
ncbi:unnamed protein product [Staphylococcus haemolyticus JCSC1435]|uniref:Uncharacterized protein n=1 Tax=Staphylococcus haemolyticus (strain JCSC1435) TaxID=279808 RepID=Q4L528_STAHJ|nr:unnamed protein product [Staphylococcus haemolyticus JCSC1435]